MNCSYLFTLRAGECIYFCMNFDNFFRTTTSFTTLYKDYSHVKMETKRELKVFYSSLTVHTDGGVKTLEASKKVRLTFKQEHDKVILTYKN